MPEGTTILWFRQNFRLEDNLAAVSAVQGAAQVVPLFIWSPEEEGVWPPGGASKWWLHHSLSSLTSHLREQGSNLIIRQGSTQQVIADVLRETCAHTVHFDNRHDPPGVAQQRALLQAGLPMQGHTVDLLFEPDKVKNLSGGPYKVFTQFYKSCVALGIDLTTLPAPRIPLCPDLSSLELEQLGLLPKIAWDAGFSDIWHPGEEGANNQLDRFLDRVENYKQSRDFMAQAGISNLSPHLRWGEISPRQVASKVCQATRLEPGEDPFVRQLFWREFSRHLLYHFPETDLHPLNKQFADFPWRTDEEALRKWQKGQTGYPVVDAGMRQLWQTGTMHNRARMVVASFLVKDLLIPWQEGAKWFWDTLVDADLANNTMGWQWTAGCGADAAPYFRVFNPVLQGKKFDPEGAYVGKWVPELRRLPPEFIHAPWTAPPDVLQMAGVELGKDYPQPMVDHDAARKRALAALESISQPSLF